MRALKHDKKSVAWSDQLGVARRDRPAEDRRRPAYQCEDPCVFRCELDYGIGEFPLMQMQRSGERGSASLKFVIVMAILVASAYAGYLYIPVAYHATMYKDLMQHYADVASAQGYKPQWVAEQLMKSAPEYQIPADAIYTPVQRDNRMEVRVQYVRADRIPRLHLQLRIRSHRKEHRVSYFQVELSTDYTRYLLICGAAKFYLGGAVEERFEFSRA